MLLVRKQRDLYIRILQEKTALSDDDLTKGGGSRHIYAFLSCSDSAARLNIPSPTIPDHDGYELLCVLVSVRSPIRISSAGIVIISSGSLGRPFLEHGLGLVCSS